MITFDDSRIDGGLAAAATQLFSSGRPLEPVIIRNAITELPLHPDAILQVLSKQLRDPDRYGSRHQRVRFYRNGRVVKQAAPFIPHSNERRLADFLGRLQAESAESVCGFTVSDPQVADDQLFRSLLVFLGAMVQRTEAAPYLVRPDIWCLNSSSALAPVHKDSHDVVTFVLLGRRRYLLWPFDYFKDQSRLGARGLYQMDSLPSIQLREHLSAAHVIDGAPGDVIFWPAEWWHVGQGVESAAMTLALGIFRDQTIADLFHDTAKAIVAMGVIGSEAAFLRSNGTDIRASFRQSLQQLTDNAAFDELLLSKLLAVTTAMGMAPPADLAESEDWRPEDRVALVTPHTASWFRRGDGELICIAAGRRITLADSEPHLKTLSLLRDGPGHTMKEILDEVAKGQPETAYNAAAELHSARLVRLLEQCHAAARVR